MAKYNTRQGITWSDDDGSFQADDIIKMYESYQNSKMRGEANDRANEQLEMQQTEIARAKDINSKIIKGKQAYGDMMVGISKSGWNEDGVWDAENINVHDTAAGYMDTMKGYDLAGDANLALSDISARKQRKLEQGGAVLKEKVQAWEAKHENDFGTNDFIPFNETYNEEKKKYIHSIGGDKLYRQAYSLGGPMGGEGIATQLTGLDKDSFATKDEWESWKTGAKVGVGVGVPLFLGSKGWKAAGESIARGDALQLDKSKGIELVKKLTKDVKTLKASGTKEALKHASKLEKFIGVVSKRGYMDGASHTILSKMASNIPGGGAVAVDAAKSSLKDAKKALKAVQEPTKTSSILKKISKLSLKSGAISFGKSMLGYQAGAKATEMAGGGEIAQLAGGITAPVLAKKLMKPANLKKLIPVIQKVSPALAKKLTLSVAGILLPEGVSTAAGIAGMLLLLKDISGYMTNPEVADTINSFE